MGRPRTYPDGSEAVLLVPVESFVVSRDGADRTFTVDQTRIMSDHEWVRGIEHLFRPCGPSRGMEQATAAPGERRGE